VVTTGLIVRLEARAGKEDELAAFLEGALPLVEQEPGTIAWLGVRIDATSFAIVDVFPDEEARLAHLAGPVAAALLDRTEELLARPPQIERAQVLAAKVPSAS
jgi:quinol monooxygenase YgiN